MGTRAAHEKWLADLTHLPTASGQEDAVVAWVSAWAARRSDLKLEIDSGGNVIITQKGRKARPPVFAVAHMDHPAFVIGEVKGSDVRYEFRGGVNPEYFSLARVEVVSRPGKTSGKVVTYDPETSTGVIEGDGFLPGDIAYFRMRKPRARKGRFAAPACDDLAGAAAALAALDRARRRDALRHFGVLLTRAEEVGLVGAVHAAKHRTIPHHSRVLSIETSRELPNARIGDGPIIRTGDYSTMFDRELTNKITRSARVNSLRHQRRLMDGGSCEATAFGGYGFQCTGLCLALGNWHNRGNLDRVEAGDGEAIPMLEEISIDDFHGLVDLLLLAASAVDDDYSLEHSLDELYEERAHYLS